MSRQSRRIVVSQRAQDDLADIAAWTAEKFGDRQAGMYVDAILETIDELLSNPARGKTRDEIGQGLRSLHMAKPGRRGRHLLLYREDAAAVTILRILHDGMELSRHLPDAENS